MANAKKYQPSPSKTGRNEPMYMATRALSTIMKALVIQDGIIA